MLLVSRFVFSCSFMCHLIRLVGYPRVSELDGTPLSRFLLPFPPHRFTFGWTRAEVLGALVNATFLLAMCLSIFMSAIARFVEVEVRLPIISHFCMYIVPHVAPL